MIQEHIDVRATGLPGSDLDYLRSFARRRGLPNTAAAVLRFAVSDLAERLRNESARPEAGQQSGDDSEVEQA